MVDKFLLKIGPQLRIVPSKKLKSLSFPEAIAIGLACREEQKEQLLKDAVEGDGYFYGRKIVDALEVSLIKLEECFPELSQCMKNLKPPMWLC